jgi:uncharacterized repeat protein (TIGR03803 family)
MRAVFAAVFAGVFICAFVQPVLAAKAGKFNENVIWSFGNGADGQNPSASLINVEGTLFGTTGHGGAHGEGTVFSLDLSSEKEKVLYSFCGQQSCADGAVPSSSLIAVKDTLYGTTQIGGAIGAGTVFAVDMNTGHERVIHEFGHTGDGAQPFAGLIEVNGKLYGTTIYGGATDAGSVFVVDRKTGTESVLYSFCSQTNCADGQLPFSGLIDLNGTLYGTTTSGGIVIGECGGGCGTVFSLNPTTGTETVIYAFCQQQSCADGEYPFSNLIESNGTLYSTTGAGGVHDSGTVFNFNLNTGAESTLYSFCNQTNCADGEYPETSLIALKAKFYGTTGDGGAHSDAGTAFALASTGVETVLHSFCAQQNCTDGESPGAGLIDVSGTLYGTTLVGGKYGKGTVFALEKR